MSWIFKTHQQPLSIPISTAQTSHLWNNLQCRRRAGGSSWISDLSWDPAACSLPIFLMTDLKPSSHHGKAQAGPTNKILHCDVENVDHDSHPGALRRCLRGEEPPPRDPRLFTWWKVSLWSLKGYLPLLKGIPGEDYLDNFRNLLPAPSAHTYFCRWSLCQENQSWNRNSLHPSRTANQT